MEWIGGITNDSPVNRFIIEDNEVNVSDTLDATMIEFWKKSMEGNKFPQVVDWRPFALSVVIYEDTYKQL